MLRHRTEQVAGGACPKRRRPSYFLVQVRAASLSLSLSLSLALSSSLWCWRVRATSPLLGFGTGARLPHSLPRPSVVPLPISLPSFFFPPYRRARRSSLLPVNLYFCRRLSIHGGKSVGAAFFGAGTKGRLDGCSIYGNAWSMAGVAVRCGAEPTVTSCKYGEGEGEGGVLTGGGGSQAHPKLKSRPPAEGKPPMCYSPQSRANPAEGDARMQWDGGRVRGHVILLRLQVHGSGVIPRFPYPRRHDVWVCFCVRYFPSSLPLLFPPIRSLPLPPVSAAARIRCGVLVIPCLVSLFLLCMLD